MAQKDFWLTLYFANTAICKIVLQDSCCGLISEWNNFFCDLYYKNQSSNMKLALLSLWCFKKTTIKERKNGL